MFLREPIVPPPDEPEPATPSLGPIGRLLPASWQDAVRARAGGFDLPGVASGLLLDQLPDPTGFDPVAARRWFWLLHQTVCRYFRLTVLGDEHLPRRGRTLVVGCHSGVYAWDATCLVVVLYRHAGRFPRAVGDFLFARSEATFRMLTRTGMIVGRPEEVTRALERDDMVLLFPGGAEDMTRPYLSARRYRVEPHKGFAPGHGGYVKIALRTRAPIVPVAVVGAEEVHVLLANVPPLARLIGFPFFPIVASPLPLPARIYVRFGPPIHLDAPPSAADDQAVVDELNVQVRTTLQALIDDTRARRRGVFWSAYDGGR